MVDSSRPGLTYAELAAKYDRSLTTIRNTWARHPAWSTIPVVGRRGRAVEFDADAADQVIREHFIREAPADLEAHRLYTVQEIAEVSGLAPGTIYSDISRGRWPAPDDVRDGAKLWRGSTVTATFASRHARRKRT